MELNPGDAGWKPKAGAPSHTGVHWQAYPVTALCSLTGLQHATSVEENLELLTATYLKAEITV